MRPLIRRAALGSTGSLWVIPALALLLTTCTEAPTPTDPGPDPDDEPSLIELVELQRDPTAWERVVEGIEQDGTVPKEVALQAFALTLGGLPDVTPPTADTIGARCGSPALRWVTPYIDTLTAEQRSAIDVALGNGGDSAARTPAGQAAEHSCTVGSAVFEDGPGSEPYRPILEQELAKLEQVLGALGIPVYLTIGEGAAGSDAHAWASPQTTSDCATATATSCRVELLTNRPELASEANLRAVVAHELVHCYQATWLPVNVALGKPDWLVEGFPDYAGEQLNPAADRVSFLVYTETPLRRLYTRTYDAQGFYFHLDTIGADVFGRIEAAYKVEGSSAAFAMLIEGLDSSFGDTWASSYALDPARGDAWYMPEAPVTAVSGMSMGTLVNGKSYLANPGEAGTRITHLDFEADVVRFEIGGGINGRISWDDGGEALLSEINGQVFCAQAGGCECPPGSSGSPPQTGIPSASAIVSSTGTTVNTQVEIFGVSLDEYCTADAEPDPTPSDGIDSCLVGGWVSDPWVLPGPIADLDGTGGDNAVVTISGDGQAQWDFNAMQPITIFDDQIKVTTELYSRGTASGRISTVGGSWQVSDTDTSAIEGFAIDSIVGEYPLAGGPGLFVLLGGGSYTCSANRLTYMTTDPVDGSAISMTLHKR